MTSFVTQCPHCRTSFRVSRAQLAAAQGVVRCGACMELFNAARYLQGDDIASDVALDSAAASQPSRSEPAPAHATSPAHPTADETLWIHDDLDLDSLDLDEELAKLERQELELSREFLELEPQPGERLRAPTDELSSADDEAWAEQLLSAETDTPTNHNRTQAEPALTAEPLAKTADLRFTPVSAEHPVPPSPLTSRSVPLNEHPDSRERVEPVFTSLIEPEVAAEPRGDAEQAPDRTTRRNREDPLFELDDEPLQLGWEAHRRPWGRWLGWGLLNLIALLALAGQYVAYNFDEVSRQDQYRPWLERVCPALGCELPPRVDISQIKSSNLVVRSHPDFAGALVVDAIIYNRASFAQPFPLLEIRFADINGQTLAQRTFKPGEYLSGELAGRREMPSQIPIHIALDILDPGAKAVNYSLSFRSPD
ncbi:DUF3426 domain-containing protein [Pseudomonas stutzeri]|uniref:DUF3426 domain-containing protein n=1 Tax=Stutzerimonas stutzeri TaxID=316 RepID=UPI00210CB7D9|nr:DUF3426 domain-containing protein [Stutzerimonas stutzeri]MCQ4289096.1 DUF3426 domain-containing protein [Stutzerimonas stutzeri]